MWIRWLHAIAMRNVEFLAISMFVFLVAFVVCKRAKTIRKWFSIVRMLVRAACQKGCPRMPVRTNWNEDMAKHFITNFYLVWSFQSIPSITHPTDRRGLLLDVCETECNLGFNSIFNENRNNFCRAAIFRHPAKAASIHRVTHTHTHCEKQLFDRPEFTQENRTVASLR